MSEGPGISSELFVKILDPSNMTVDMSGGTAKFVLTNAIGDAWHLTLTPDALEVFASTVMQAARNLLVAKYGATHGVDTLALTVVLTRLVQVISGTLLTLAENRGGAEGSLGIHLFALADETEWVCDVLRKAARTDTEPDGE